MKRACRSVKDSRTPAGPLLPSPNSDHCIHQFSLADEIRLLPGLAALDRLHFHKAEFGQAAADDAVVHRRAEALSRPLLRAIPLYVVLQQMGIGLGQLIRVETGIPLLSSKPVEQLHDLPNVERVQRRVAVDIIKQILVEKSPPQA